MIHDYIWVIESCWMCCLLEETERPENHLQIIIYIYIVSQILPKGQRDHYSKSTLIWMYLINFFRIVSNWSFPTGRSDKRNRHVRENIHLCSFYFYLQWSGDVITLKHSHKFVLVHLHSSMWVEKIAYSMLSTI